MSVTRAIAWYRRLTPFKKSLILSVFFVVPAVITAVMDYYVQSSFTEFRINLLVLVGLFFLFVVAQSYIRLRAETIDKATESQQNALGQAYASLDGIVALRMKKPDAASALYQADGSSQLLFEVSIASLEHVESLVAALYEVVQSQFGQAGSLLGSIDFEVTFMTRSYQDGKLTVYACRNRDYREPRSLILRRENTDIYERTVTAQVYRAPRPEMQVVEDTREEAYEELYPGQLERIRSSVICPVLSDRNELLGTIVVHCNKGGFFKKKDALFWRRLIEIYAKRVAYEKTCLDLFPSLDLRRWIEQVNPAAVRPSR